MRLSCYKISSAVKSYCKPHWQPARCFLFDVNFKLDAVLARRTFLVSCSTCSKMSSLCCTFLCRSQHQYSSWEGLRCRAGNGSLRVTHDPCDPWPMGHRHRARHPILAQALHRFIEYPALHLDIVYVHTPLSCYIIAHVSKLHTQTPVILEFVNWKLKHCIT